MAPLYNDKTVYMDITYLGHAAFKIKTAKATIVTDPFDPKMVGLKFPKVSADLVTVSHHHPDHDFIEAVTDIRKVIDGPGEYEALDVSVFGFPSTHDDKGGVERGKNTIYVIEADGLRLAHLGDLGDALTDAQVNELGDIDVLFIPVGGFFTIGAKQAGEVVAAIEPNIVVPMHYQQNGLNANNFSQLASVDDFISSSTLPNERTAKLTVKAGSVDETSKIVVFDIKV